MTDTQQRPGNFNGATRQNRIALPPIRYQANGPSQSQLLRVGLVAKITIMVAITVTTGATGTYALKIGRGKTGGVTPYDCIPRVRVTINGTSEVVNCSWWGLYQYAKMKQLAYDYRQPFVGTDSANTQALVFSNPVPSANNQSYTYRCPLVIPIALGSNLAASLLLGQSPSSSIIVELNWADITTNLLTLGGTTPSLTVNNVSAIPMVEYYNVPADLVDYPNLSMIKRIVETIDDVSANGDYTYRPPIGNALLSLTQEFVNNGAGLPPANFDNVAIKYSGSQVPYYHAVANLLIENYERFGQHFPDGVLNHKFDYAGILTMPNSRDIFDLARVTDIQFVTGITGVGSFTNAFVRTLREELAPAI